MVNFITEHIDVWTAAQTQKNNGGRGRSKNSNGQSPHGIKKLRELILELAVRGKLVPQDPNDEPASELLKKIAKEKDRLIKEGKIKKQKPLPEISEEDKPFELPNGWEWVRLGATGIGSTGKTPSTKNPKYYDGAIHFLGPGQITLEGDITDSEKTLSEEGCEYSTIAESGDILMVCIGGSIGKSAIARSKVAFNQQINRIRPLYVDSTYLNVAINTPHFQTSILDAATGSATPIINRSKWEELLVALPSLAEQHRIVAKVDELMALCGQLEQYHTANNETHQTLVETLLATLTNGADQKEFARAWQRISKNFDTLFTTEQSIDQLKQTIHQLAVMGKLVPQDPNDEPAIVLLEKIAKEKTWLIKKGEINKQKYLPEISEDEKPFALPKGWEWAQCQNICYKITDGQHATPQRSDSGYYLLSARNVTNEGIILNDVDFVPLYEFEKIRKRCDPNIGDILISCSGSVGRVALVDRDEAYSMVRSAAMIRPDNILLSKEFVALALRSPYLQEQMVNRSRKSAQANLFLGAISRLVLVIPPLSEQYRIVAKVDELMALCDALKDRLGEAQTTQIQMANAIVEQAVE